MVSLVDFQSKGYLVTSLVGLPPETTYGANDPHHRFRKNNYFGHVTGPSQYQGLQKINIGSGQDTVYLPYFQNKISSVHLPATGPFFFVTDNMSGCAFFIATYPDGSLVVFHGNTQLGSDEATMAPAKANHQTAGATNQLNTLFNGALPHHPGAALTRSLMKAEYLQALGNMNITGGNFLGGTTIAGWRTGASWEFWFQNWGSVGGNGAGLLYVKKFYP